MFFVRVSSIKNLLKLDLKESDFENETGQVDGTLAHAIERIFAVCMIAENKRIISTDFLDQDESMIKSPYKFTEN